MGCEKESLRKQNQRPDAEAKVNKILIFYFPSVGDAQEAGFQKKNITILNGLHPPPPFS